MNNHSDPVNSKGFGAVERGDWNARPAMSVAPKHRKSRPEEEDKPSAH